MPADLRAHVRYPELLLEVQAAAFSLYHMRDPEVFYNREDLWSVASEVTLERGPRAGDAADRAELRADEAARARRSLEFVEILPFTPANRNNLIGWIAGAQRRRRTTARRSSTTSRRRGWWTARCRSRRGSIRTPSCRRS